MSGLTKSKSRQQRAEARALEAAAQILEAEAKRLRRDAEVAAHHADWIADMADIPERLADVRRWIDSGKSEADAVALVARAHELRADSLAHYFAADEAARPRARKWRRDREIMRLAWAGLSNAEIAARVGRLRPKSISRIIQHRIKGLKVLRPPGALQHKGEKPCEALLSPPLSLPSS